MKAHLNRILAVVVLAAGGVIPGYSETSAPTPKPKPYADLVVTNARITTQDPQQPAASALAVKD